MAGSLRSQRLPRRDSAGTPYAFHQHGLRFSKVRDNSRHCGRGPCATWSSPLGCFAACSSCRNRRQLPSGTMCCSMHVAAELSDRIPCQGLAFRVVPSLLTTPCRLLNGFAPNPLARLAITLHCNCLLLEPSCMRLRSQYFHVPSEECHYSPLSFLCVTARGFVATR